MLVRCTYRPVEFRPHDDCTAPRPVRRTLNPLVTQFFRQLPIQLLPFWGFLLCHTIGTGRRSRLHAPTALQTLCSNGNKSPPP